ncbi:uncharacterized protein LOC117222571 [Megalopta genalis]|uniref:uncharacterized protein LOC117222571 n=1 Tax=Megalopta genalis TaxID=115081 RepID=UPI0014432E7E|nr:uncharacterized protein LOC117222571 [Megalopta genalis]
MQNYLTTRYRQVHDKIKDVRISSLKNKLPKNMRMVSLLEHIPTQSMVTKLSLVGTRITQLPYFPKSLNVKYWTIGLIVSLPVFYQFQTMASPTNLTTLQTKQASIGTEETTEGSTAGTE